MRPHSKKGAAPYLEGRKAPQRSQEEAEQVDLSLLAYLFIQLQFYMAVTSSLNLCLKMDSFACIFGFSF